VAVSLPPHLALAFLLFLILDESLHHLVLFFLFVVFLVSAADSEAKKNDGLFPLLVSLLALLFCPLFLSHRFLIFGAVPLTNDNPSPEGE
jgi:hypothetical protein